MTLFIANLDHPLKEGVEEVRSAILGSNGQITEHIKWNAPSYCYRGEGRVTTRLHPADRLQLVFHRGAKARQERNFTFSDETGLLHWVAADRAVVTLHDLEDVRAKLAALVTVVNRWMEATG